MKSQAYLLAPCALILALTLAGPAQAQADADPCAEVKARLDRVNKYVAEYDAREQRVNADIKSYRKIRANMLSTPADSLDARILTYRKYISDQQASTKAETDPVGHRRRLEAANLSLQLLLQMKLGPVTADPLQTKLQQLEAQSRTLDQERRQRLGDLPNRTWNEWRECRRQAGDPSAQAAPGTYGDPGSSTEGALDGRLKMKPMSEEDTQAMAGAVTPRTGTRPVTDLQKYPIGGDWDIRNAPGDPWRQSGQIISNLARSEWLAQIFKVGASTTISALRFTGPNTFAATDWNRTGVLVEGGNAIQWSDGSYWRRSTGAAPFEDPQ